MLYLPGCENYYYTLHLQMTAMSAMVWFRFEQCVRDPSASFQVTSQKPKLG